MEVEIDVLCHKLLCSNNPGMQCGALYLLALMADRHGDKEAAMKYVSELPSMYVGREIMPESSFRPFGMLLRGARLPKGTKSMPESPIQLFGMLLGGAPACQRKKA